MVGKSEYIPGHPRSQGGLPEAGVGGGASWDDWDSSFRLPGVSPAAWSLVSLERPRLRLVSWGCNKLTES